MIFDALVSLRKLVLLSSLVWCLAVTIPPSQLQLQAQSPVSQAEKDDLAFIRNLYNDKIYTYASQETESFLEKYPGSTLTPEILFIQAQINVVEGKFEQALGHYTRIIGQYPDSGLVEDALYFSGALRLQLGQKDGLLQFDRLQVKFPHSKFLPRISFHKGELAFGEKDWPQAEIDFKQVLTAEGIDDEQRLKTQHYLAWVYYFQNNKLLAKSMFFELLESPISDENKAKMAFQLGIEAQEAKRYKNAITWFEKQLHEWPHPDLQARSRFLIAECHYLIFKQQPEESTEQDREQAIELYTFNLKTNEPISPQVSRYHRGWLLISVNRPDEAEQDFSWLQQNSELYAADLELTATRARYYETRNNLAEANKVYTQALNQQHEDPIRNMMMISVVRNAHTLNDCETIIKWKNKADLSTTNKDAPEYAYYGGRCHFAKKEWRQAANDFARIPLDTQYAKAVFPNYLELFKTTKDFKGGIAYLTQLEKYPQFGELEKILLLQVDFCLTFEQWAQAIDTMLRVEKKFPGKAKDPWFLLNIAKTADQVVSVIKKKKHPIHQFPVKQKSYYDNLALSYYQTAIRVLPVKEKDTKLSILDRLIVRYKAASNHKKVVALYRDASKLITDKKRQDELRFAIATILLKDMKLTQQAQSELYKIHVGGNNTVNFEASSLLAELYVEQKKYVQAIKILEDLAQRPIQKTRWFSLTHFRLGELYQSNERWNKAIAHYDLVVNDNRNSDLVQQARTRAEEIRKYLEQKGKSPDAD